MLTDIVCFQFEYGVEVIPAEIPCDWGMKYQSVIGYGKAEFIGDIPGKCNALKIIMAQYEQKEANFSEKKLEKTTIFKVKIENITGKQSGF